MPYFSSLFAPFILNNLNRSTINNGIKDIKSTISQCLPSIRVRLKASFNAGINKTTRASAAEIMTAPIRGLFFKGLIDSEDLVTECRLCKYQGRECHCPAQYLTSVT